jgi:hypothetical protein
MVGVSSLAATPCEKCQPMPDIDRGGTSGRDMETRVAVLEEIAGATKEALVEIRDDLRGMRRDHISAITSLRAEIIELRSDFREGIRSARTEVRWLLGLSLIGWIAIIGLIALGFHWY